MRNFAGFVQDRASYARVTLNLGLRWSYYDGKIPAQTGGGGKWFPVTSYPEIDPAAAGTRSRRAPASSFKLHGRRQERREGQLQPLLRVDDTSESRDTSTRTRSQTERASRPGRSSATPTAQRQRWTATSWRHADDASSCAEVERDRSEPEGSEERRDHVRVPARAGRATGR